MSLNPRLIVLPPNIERKDYQIEALCGVVDQWNTGHHATLLCMPTGTGKTITAGLVIKYAIEELGHSVLFLANRTELIEQATNTCVKAFGFATAVEMAGSSERDFINKYGRQPEVVVGTVQSFYEERLMANYKPDRFGLIVFDEAHHSTAKSYRSVKDYFRDARVLGLTATPDGSTGNLGDIYQSIAYQMRLAKAVEDVHLVTPLLRKVMVPINLKEIRTTGGDFNLGDLAERIGPAVEILCEQINANIGSRKTVVFTPDVGSAQAVAEMLKQMGRPAEYVAGEGGKFGITKEERKQRLKRFEANDFQVIVSCDLLVEGWDMPDVSCVVIARPTTKRYKLAQMVGRGLRLFPGKVNCLVLDLDWQQDDSSRTLCKLHSLYAEGGEDEREKDAMEILGDRIEKTRPTKEKPSEDIDILKELREIESDLHRARIIQVKYTGKHKEIYECVDKTPFGVGKVLDIKVRKSKDFDPYKCGPATPFQAQKLASLGVEGADKMNLWGASRLLQKLESRDRNGLASHQQVKELLAGGVNEEQARKASKKEAAAIITELIIKQGEMF